MDITLALVHPMVRRFLNRGALATQQERAARIGSAERYHAHAEARLAWTSAAATVVLDVMDAEDTDDDLRGRVWEAVAREIAATADRWDALDSQRVTA